MFFNSLIRVNEGIQEKERTYRTGVRFGFIFSYSNKYVILDNLLQFHASVSHSENDSHCFID